MKEQYIKEINQFKDTLIVRYDYTDRKDNGDRCKFDSISIWTNKITITKNTSRTYDSFNVYFSSNEEALIFFNDAVDKYDAGDEFIFFPKEHIIYPIQFKPDVAKIISKMSHGRLIEYIKSGNTSLSTDGCEYYSFSDFNLVGIETPSIINSLTNKALRCVSIQSGGSYCIGKNVEYDLNTIMKINHDIIVDLVNESRFTHIQKLYLVDIGLNVGENSYRFNVFSLHGLNINY